MTGLSQTRAAVSYIAQNAPAPLTRHRALLLGEQLASCASAAPTPGMLRQMVIAVRNLAGPAWLDTHASDPGVSAFTHLDGTPAPPPLPVLDQILCHCLRARFTPAPALAGPPVAQPSGQHLAQPQT